MFNKYLSDSRFLTTIFNTNTPFCTFANEMIREQEEEEGRSGRFIKFECFDLFTLVQTNKIQRNFCVQSF